MNQEQSILDIKALLETTNSTNEQLKEGIAGVDTSVTELGQTTIEIAKTVVATSDNAFESNTKLDRVIENTESVEEGLQDLNKNIESIKEFDGINAELKDEFKQDLTDILTQLRDNKVSVHDAVQAMGEKYTEQVISVSNKLTSIKDAVESGEYESKLAEAREEIEALRKDVADLQRKQEEDSVKYSERQVQLIEKVNTLIGDIKTSNSGVETLTSKLDSATTRLGVVETRVDALGK